MLDNFRGKVLKEGINIDIILKSQKVYTTYI